MRKKEALVERSSTTPLLRSRSGAPLWRSALALPLLRSRSALPLGLPSPLLSYANGETPPQIPYSVERWRGGEVGGGKNARKKEWGSGATLQD